jgi:predicted ATP-dependent endonuclease of OLD family
LKITKLKIENYRTFENIEFNFDDSYSAICGQNDAGKSNIVRALRGILKEDNILGRTRMHSISALRDYPRWKDTKDEDKKTNITIELTIYKDADAGVYEFFVDYLDLEESKSILNLTLYSKWKDSISASEVVAEIDGHMFDGIKAQEIHKKVQSSILIHNSTEIESRASFTGFFQEFSEEYSKELSKMSATLKKSLTKIARSQKEEVSWR